MDSPPFCSKMSVMTFFRPILPLPIFLFSQMFVRGVCTNGALISRAEEGKIVPKASYSTVFEQSADQVWAVIRDFNSYPVWVANVAESHY